MNAHQDIILLAKACLRTLKQIQLLHSKIHAKFFVFWVKIVGVQLPTKPLPTRLLNEGFAQNTLPFGPFYPTGL